ncbi:MAG: BolA family transcriptional regulator [Burkholderiaceae bacterium]|jgi:BolA protein|nr:BolA family transcriptional regulator [Burkholderiaceae bacterium]GIL04517.1 MAG: BolA family transcriptional regulator [Betaproteobacteria bacterium]
MPEGTVAKIRERIERALAPLALRIEDESALHAGHEGAKSGGGHYRVHLVSPKFEGLARVARHRLVYDALEDLMKREVHALSLVLLAPHEDGASRSRTPEGKSKS